MSNTRVIVQDGALSRAARNGDTILNPVISTVTADAAATISAAQIAGGVVQYTAFSAGRVLTTDTAVNILAAFTGMDVGDSISLVVSCVAAFAGTYAAGAGVTLAGRATTPASSYSLIYITKTSATTVTWTVL
jgi:hypothetical protein